MPCAEARSSTNTTIVPDPPQPSRTERNALPQAAHDQWGTVTRSGPTQDIAWRKAGRLSTGLEADEMRALMTMSDTESFSKIWELWSQLDARQQDEMRPSIIQYLHKSDNLIDAQRVVSLFSQLGIDSWDPHIVTAAVAAELRLGNLDTALDYYQTGLTWGKLVGGFDHLLAHGFQTSSWALVLQVWDAFAELRATKAVEFGDLNTTKSLPDLGTRLLSFRKYLETVLKETEMSSSSSSTVPTLTASGPIAVSRLLKALARGVLQQQSCQPGEALPLLQILNKADLYFAYLNQAHEEGKTTNLPEIYRVYRTLPRFRPNWKILHHMFEIFYPHDIKGLEQIYEDYHRAFGGLDQWGFRKYLKFYASRGDVRSVRRMWTTYVEEFKHKAVIAAPETWNHILNAYKNRGIVEDTQTAFDEMVATGEVTPDVVSWNILLNAYTKTDRYEDAIAVFEDLSKHVEPDSVSFATMMAKAGALGDLDYTLELYEQAKALEAQAHAAVFYGVVSAYCQNDKMEEAQNVCINASTMKIRGDTVDLWNCLLKHQGHRRDLMGTYQILDLMKEYGVEWNATTYDLLMRSLVFTKEAHHAYRLLRTAIEDQVFPVREHHFAMVMSSALRCHDLALVRSVTNLMSRSGHPMSMGTSIASVDAELRRRFKPWEGASGEIDGEQSRELGRTIVEYYERVLQTGQRDALFDPERKLVMHSGTGDVELLQLHAGSVQSAMEVLVQFRDFVSLEQLLKLFSQAVSGGSPDKQQLPLPMLESIMLADVLEGKHDKVKEAWNHAWNTAMRLGKPPSYKQEGILPLYQYALSGSLNSMQRVFSAEGDHQGLQALVGQVTGAGFKLHSSHWNNICRALAEMGQWLKACTTCEDVLMPNWQGWAAQRATSRSRFRGGSRSGALPLERRRMGNAPRFLRPNAETLVMLADHYLVLVKQGPWSGEAKRTLSEFKARCPKLWHAFRTRVEHTEFGLKKPDIKEAW